MARSSSRLWLRVKQWGMVGFVALNTTFLIQNISYPEGLEPWKRTYKALLGLLVFLAGFAVAKVLYDLYKAELVEARKITDATANQPAFNQSSEGADGLGVHDCAHGGEDGNATGERPANRIEDI